MHEFSIARSLLRRVEAEALKHGASSVRRIQLRLGELSGIEADLLRSAFEILRPGTVCSGADLAIHEVPATWSCAVCGVAIEAGAALRCPRCRRPAQLSAGSETLLEHLEMEVA